MMDYVKYSLVFIWMFVIFCLSSEPAVASTARSDVLLHAIQSIQLSFFKHATEFIIRKSAHFSAYLILGILIFNLVKDYAHRALKGALLTILFASLYACTDEFHQLFVPGRTGQMRDVLIDTIGAAVGVGLYISIECWHRRRTRTRPGITRVENT